MSGHDLRPIWTPEDAHEVFERAATIQAIRAASEALPREVGNSALLADLVAEEPPPL
jgi:hypothetical protein